MANRRKWKRYENDRLEAGLTRVDDSGGVGEFEDDAVDRYGIPRPVLAPQYRVASYL